MFRSYKRKYYYSISQKRFVIHPSVVFGKRFSIKSDQTNTSIFIDSNTQFRENCFIRMGSEGKLTIGRYCFFNNNCSFNCLDTIEIGDNTQFGEDVRLYDANHLYKDKEKLISEQGVSKDKISIGSNCWIGANVVILKGVSIGNNAIIGAGCIIYKSIPPDSLVIQKQELEIRSTR